MPPFLLRGSRRARSGLTGRYHIAPLAFDPHRKDWFDANDPPRRPHDWSYWSNRRANWNSMCAYCHMTGLEKNYDIATDSYATTWTTQGISCTQCHGDMAAHLADPQNPAKIARLPADLAIDNCASCHARREEITGAFGPGERFHDHYRVSLPDQPNIYYADGQILDEDFEYGSMLLNRMGHKGVTCLDCHNPHSGKLKLPVENNALCMSCHTPPGQNNATPIDPAAHTFHKSGTPGSLCIDCHMAPTTYMVRDPRRDHGFVSPDPQLTIEAGIPNNCNRCHGDQSPEWARDWVDRWYGAEKMESRPARRRARVILRAQQGAAGFDPELLALARGEEIPAWRATLVLLLAPWNQHPDVAPALREWLADPSPLVRSAAIRAMGSFEAPLGLARSQYGDLPAALEALDRAAKTSPGSADPDYAAATIHLRLGRADEARAAIRRALQQNPAHTPSLQLQRRLNTPRPDRASRHD